MDSLTKLNLDNYKPLRDVVFENLRSAILEGKLKSGQRLMEVQLAEQLGVSRTPVREAIRKLELEGLVVMLPRKGAYVANISVKDLMDVLEIRASLEGLGASLAAERRTEEDIKNLEEIEEEFEQAVITQDIDMLLKKDIEFHECIFKAANNKKLEKMINSFEEKNIKFDCVSGASSGSIIATMYALGYSSDEMWKMFQKYYKKIKKYCNIIKMIVQ